MNLEHRAVRLIETKVDADTPGAFSGYAAAFGNTDAMGDVIRRGAFTETLKEWEERGKWPPMLLQHGGGFFGGGSDDLLPVGQWTEMEENQRGLKVEGQLFAMGTDRGQYLYEGLKSGVLDGLSIGFRTKEFIAGTKPDEPDRTLTAIDLWEVSIVTFPANPKARVTAVKTMTIEELRDLEGALRDGGLSRTDRLKAIAVFKRWSQRDAGAPHGAPRDAAVPDEETQRLLDAMDASLTSAFMRSALGASRR